MYDQGMEHPLRAWLIDLLEWVGVHRAEYEKIADWIIGEFEKGVIATTPPDGGT